MYPLHKKGKIAGIFQHQLSLPAWVSWELKQKKCKITLLFSKLTLMLDHRTIGIKSTRKEEYFLQLWGNYYYNIPC